MYYIYKTTNIVNGKCYVGKHKANKLNNSYIGSGKILKKAIKKYGKENFIKEIIEISYEFNINEREKYWIKFYKCKYPNGYNIENGGQGGDFITNHPERKSILEKMKKRTPWNKGKEMSEKSKQRMKDSFYMNDLRRERMSESHKGKTAWNKGKKMSKEQRDKLSSSHKGKIPWNKGKKLTEEQKKNQFKFSKGNVPWNKGFVGVIHSSKKGVKTGLHWFTNGIDNICCKDCPTGYWRGRIIKKKD